MGFSIYIYSEKNYSELHDRLKDKFSFTSLAVLFNASENVSKISLLDLDNTIVDLTTLCKGNNYYKLFIERYLSELTNSFSNIHFSLQKVYLELFQDEFPVFCLDAEINRDYVTAVDLDDKQVFEHVVNSEKLLKLYTYDNYSTMRDMIRDNRALSFSQLSELDKTTLKQTILESQIEYIDLSSIVSKLKYLPENTFNVEVLLHLINIISTSGISFSTQDDLKNDIAVLFPLLFDDIEQIEENIEITDCLVTAENSIGLDKSKLSEISRLIHTRLQGHQSFKKDFDKCLMKFYILSRLKERSILSIFLCGDSGIGKTEFAKMLSDIIYPGEPLIKINFGNYSTEGVLNSLIGSPRGYIGSEDGGELINKLARSKSQIVLIDEFERATPSVFNFFYELLEDGKFTDRMGNEHNMNGFIIIFTSNLNRKNYQKVIPASLFSRFDMKYVFEQLCEVDKEIYINDVANRLIGLLAKEYEIVIDIHSIASELKRLNAHSNLREIKRNIEDIVINKFFEQYQNGVSQ